MGGLVTDGLAVYHPVVGELMRGPSIRRLACLLAVVVGAAAPAGSGTGKCSGRESDTDCVLYSIVRKCIDTSAPDYCTACHFPRAGYCPQKATCETTTEVWTGTTRFVVIRDRTMCSCPEVVHGLVLPSGAVSGVEDPDRPPAIWRFAWGITEAAGLADDTAVLIANPPAHRTQSQLHIHVLPIDPAKISALEATPTDSVTDLNAVWPRADALAASRGMKSFGVVVHKAGAAWHVHVADDLLTDAYSLLPECARPNRKPGSPR